MAMEEQHGNKWKRKTILTTPDKPFDPSADSFCTSYPHQSYHKDSKDFKTDSYSIMTNITNPQKYIDDRPVF